MSACYFTRAYDNISALKVVVYSDIFVYGDIEPDMTAICIAIAEMIMDLY